MVVSKNSIGRLLIGRRAEEEESVISITKFFLVDHFAAYVKQFGIQIIIENLF